MPSIEQLFAAPPAQVHLHFLGICGIAMGQMAVALQQAGYRVSGSDQQNDPPMSDLLTSAGIPVLPLETASAKIENVDLLVVGRGIDAADPAIAAFAKRRIPQVSYPELIVHFTRACEQRIVVAGTKGKTTTTAMLAWIADCAGLDPTFLIGGLPGNFPLGLRLTHAPLAILEGDEYASSPTDLTPKFAHYQPTAAVLTNIYPDHVELYPDFANYRALFSRLLANLPHAGFAVACGDSEAGVRDIMASTSAPLTTVGWTAESDLQITNYRLQNDRTYFDFLETSFHLPVFGKASVMDAALAATAALQIGIEPAFSAEALRKFLPVKERLEHVGTPGGVRLFLESNVHPAALRLAVEALRERFPTSQLLCIIQPQTPGSGDGYVQRHLASALTSATHVLLTPPANQIVEDPASPFSSEKLLAELTSQQISAAYRDTRKDIVSWVVEHSRPGDTLLLAVHAPSRALLVREIGKALAP